MRCRRCWQPPESGVLLAAFSTRRAADATGGAVGPSSAGSGPGRARRSRAGPRGRGGADVHLVIVLGGRAVRAEGQWVALRQRALRQAGRMRLRGCAGSEAPRRHKWGKRRGGERNLQRQLSGSLPARPARPATCYKQRPQHPPPWPHFRPHAPFLRPRDRGQRSRYWWASGSEGGCDVATLSSVATKGSMTGVQTRNLVMSTALLCQSGPQLLKGSADKTAPVL